MNDCLIVYIERDVAYNIDNETIIQRFQNIKTYKKVIVNFIYLHVFFISVVVNIWISLFIKLYNLCFLRNTLRKFLEPPLYFHKKFAIILQKIQGDKLIMVVTIGIIIIIMSMVGLD